MDSVIERQQGEDQLRAAETQARLLTLPGRSIGKISDGYHTFDELYDFRKVYNASLFNEWARLGLYSVHKSLKHHDGEDAFGGGWFIVVAVLPEGQISNHYRLEDWDMFQIPECEKALFEFDGHTPKDVLARLKAVVIPANRLVDFGVATRAAKQGKRVARIGWNGVGMYAYYVPAASYPALTESAKAEFGENGMVPYRAYWALKTAQGDVATWAPSGSDSLAEDWVVLD